MRELRRLLAFLGPYRWDLLMGGLLVLIETAFELVIPVLMADLIDVGVENQDLHYIVGKGIQMGVCALLALVTGLLYARFAAKAAYGWGANIREAQYERVQSYGFSNLDKFESSSLVTRMTTDVTVLQISIVPTPENMPCPGWTCTSKQARLWVFLGAPGPPRPPWSSLFRGCTMPLMGL